MKAHAVLFLVVALLGTLHDQIHVQFDVLFYPRPFLFGQAFWVPLLMGASGVLLVGSYAPFRRLSADSTTPPPWCFALALLDFSAAYFATGVFKDRPVALAAGLVVAWLAIVIASGVTREKLLLAAAVVLGGVATEIAISWAGGFHYRKTELGPVPLWLPALYLHVSVLSRATARTFFAPSASTS